MTGNDAQTQAVMNYAVLPNLWALLWSPKESIRKESALSLSNILAGSQRQIQAVLDNGCIIPAIVAILCTAGEAHAVKKEAAWAISNGTSGGSQEQIACLVECGAIGALCGALYIDSITNVALEGLSNILRSGCRQGGTEDTGRSISMAQVVVREGHLQAIENLQNHEQASSLKHQH